MENSEGKEVTEYAWLDISSGAVSFAISERVTITLPLNEVMDFFNTIGMLVDTLKTTDGITLGTYEYMGETYEQFMLTPEEDDFN